MPQVLGHLEKEAEMATAALVGLIHGPYLYIRSESAIPGYIRKQIHRTAIVAL